MDWKGKKVIAISEDVASQLDDEELEAVLAHELGHLLGLNHTEEFAFATGANSYNGPNLMAAGPSQSLSNFTDGLMAFGSAPVFSQEINTGGALSDGANQLVQWLK